MKTVRIKVSDDTLAVLDVYFRVFTNAEKGGLLDEPKISTEITKAIDQAKDGYIELTSEQIQQIKADLVDSGLPVFLAQLVQID